MIQSGSLRLMQISNVTVEMGEETRRDRKLQCVVYQLIQQLKKNETSRRYRGPGPSKSQN